MAIACRVCLMIEAKMYPLVNSPLEEIFIILTGIIPHTMDYRPQYICFECHCRLKKVQDFREKCLRSENLLTQVMEPHSELTEEIIKIIDRKFYQLESNLSCKSLVVEISYSQEITPKEEIQEENSLSVEVPLTPRPVTPDVINYDSDDDVPLKLMKVEKKPKISKKMKLELKKKKIRGFKEDYATEIILSKEEQLEELKKRSESINYLHSPYKCDFCYKGFIDSVAYYNHKGKHDENRGPHECEICRARYSNHRQLSSHVATSHSRRYVCKRCKHCSHTANQARDHEKWHRGFLYECRLCSRKFRKPTTHLTHMRKQHPTEFVCAVCGGSFVGRHGLLMHQTKMHRTYVEEGTAESQKDLERAPECYCSECDVHFVSLEAKHRHLVISLRHTLSNRSTDACTACGESFRSAEELTRHMKQHSTLRDPNAPGRGEPVKRRLLKKVACDTCGSQFVSRSKLQAHVRRVHLGLKYNKDVVCEVCGKHCTSNATLKYHQRTHTGERPYECGSCPKRFSDKNQLRIHVRTHTDERPYSCALCEKTFRQKPALNRHTRVHTGAKPYECPYCAKGFSQSNSMKLHVRTIHLKLPQTRRAKGHAAVAPAIAGSDDQKVDISNVLTLQQL